MGYERDLPGKPKGWISRPIPHGVIAFNITTRKGWIRLEHLVTFTKDIGGVTCWLDEDDEPRSPQSCPFNGRWSGRHSFTTFSYLQTSLPPGEHILRCRS